MKRTATLGSVMATFMTLLTGCASMRAEVEINAPPQCVWNILTDLESYPQWNPYRPKTRSRALAAVRHPRRDGGGLIVSPAQTPLSTAGAV